MRPAMALVTRHWSGKHGHVVRGINLISLVWTDGACRLPCDFRLYHKAEDALSKNDHFQHMLKQAEARGFQPKLVVFDSWYSGLANRKLLRSLGWLWLTQLKGNRQVSLGRSGTRPIWEVFNPVQGCQVHLKGYGWVKVFRTVGTNGDAEYWATSRLDMSIEQAAFYALDACGRSRSIIAVSNSSPGSNAVSISWKSRSAIISVWQTGLSCAWRSIG